MCKKVGTITEGDMPGAAFGPAALAPPDFFRQSLFFVGRRPVKIFLRVIYISTYIIYNVCFPWYKKKKIKFSRKSQFCKQNYKIGLC